MDETGGGSTHRHLAFDLRHVEAFRTALQQIAADRRAMVAAEAMGAVYWRLLRRMEDAKFRVLDPSPTRLGRLHKLALVFGTWWRIKTGSQSPNYGRY